MRNLNGPILASSTINLDRPEHRMIGNDDRARVCHFVRARLLSTYNFLSIHSNEDKACILLNRCFEQMAFLTINHHQPANNWIKPLFTTVRDQLKAEKKYTNQVFYFIHRNLAEHKTYINQLNLQSQIQTKLQDYMNDLPGILQSEHFKTELNDPMHSQLPLKILRYIMNSNDFLNITKWIYDLSQFYLLLHGTYTNLVEQEDFHDITLNELHNRAKKRFNSTHLYGQSHGIANHLSIINNGIKAVNAYHEFADGFIRPGVCDQTQRFITIDLEKRIDYLVTTPDRDAGNIVMRILRYQCVQIIYFNKCFFSISVFWSNTITIY